MSLYTYELVVIVEADSKENAWTLLREASQALNKAEIEVITANYVEALE